MKDEGFELENRNLGMHFTHNLSLICVILILLYFSDFFFQSRTNRMITYCDLSYAPCRNLMAKQDMSELGFVKESDKEASEEKITERIGN